MRLNLLIVVIENLFIRRSSEIIEILNPFLFISKRVNLYGIIARLEINHQYQTANTYIFKLEPHLD